ncbi:MAG: terpene utilization protein AtuA [Myxococcaceae bacterium]|nr:terpene utilization protein AtuA [Myxococcaceae bacterium]
MTTLRTLRIGGGCGFWGDSAAGAAQLVQSGEIDVLVLDYLSEVTMSLLARARQKRPELGYATDFVTAVMEPLARQISERRIRVVTNAGGVNPEGCRRALLSVFERLGVSLKVAVVTGDDISSQLSRLRAAGVLDMETGGPLPASVASANAYLGAFPIADALRRGADLVITGRCADSALALGPLVAEFGMRESELDKLALGSLAGHILECGPQATGGIFTDWQAVAESWDDMGYPIVEYDDSDSFVVTKPANTGGLVTTSTVAEQVTYEVHDPGHYILPDVVCDFTGVRLEQLGLHRVRVGGARGLAPTPDYKACLTYHDGYRCMATVLIVGPDAAPRATQVGHAILKRTRRLLSAAGSADYRATSVEVLGAESMYGPHARAAGTREVLLKVAVSHDDKSALELFAREIAPAVTSMAQGLTGIAGGRPAVQPVVRLASCLIPKSEVVAQVELDGQVAHYAAPLVWLEPARASATTTVPAALPGAGPTCLVPLLRLAHGRSGDKGDTSNISVLARRTEFLPVLAAQLTPAAVRSYLAHLVEGEVQRFDWPGLDGWNFVLRQALGGGGIASLRYDPQGKCYAQLLMDFPVAVPVEWIRPGGLLGDGGGSVA